ncbi:ComEC/Rec2 family competence protein [Psychroserpens burtonensis]|uniref:ComEC/Rec2 family competence protein n=1 Tax=Psychroserpens burtonensis TaxID=49278 RepID=A0A5C7B972_9FLAO|nr:ComEC/Rec2 family competence protein [Psychroserpens burtonensis]TXE18900.1 ComEC/Rec2 family competence protein [Psychroserpens burtonensis]
MKLLNFTIIKLTCCVIMGILIAEYLRVPLLISIYTSLILVCLLAVLFLISRNNLHKTIWFGLITILTMTSLGVLIYNTHDQSNFKNHYSWHISEEKLNETPVVFKIRERLKSGNYNDKYIIDILKVNGEKVNGKSLLNIKKDSANRLHKIDDVLLMNAIFRVVNKPTNPNQFDYGKYLGKQYVYHQLFTENTSVLTLKSERSSIFGYADAIRTHINEKLENYNFKPEELAIINALILGQRQDMSKDIYDSYTGAGAIHILAVSGLHVGLILLLLTIGLRPIERIKNGKTIKVVLILILLWLFAIVAGLSASVTRAVTMFSIVAIAMHMKRPTNIFNTLAISMFVLLLVKPMFLFDVGFQLSYVAVLAIVSLQPLLYKLWKPKWKLIDYFWQILTVTVAAQFGVVPLSLYYFHQFPSLFFISNLAIIPFLGMILGLGILIIILAVLNALPQFFADLYGSIISGMNTVVTWVSQQEAFLFKNISINELQVFACYLLIITLAFWYKKPNFKRLAFALISILCLQSAWLFTDYQNSNNEFIIFHKSRKTLIAKKIKSTLHTAHNLDSISWSKDRVITNFNVGNFITTNTLDTLKSVYIFQDKTILIIDSLGVYAVKSFKPDYVLLRNSPRINIDRMIDSIQPKYIIADGSNYTSYVNRWEQTCIKRKLPFHHTSKKGAFIIK